MYVDNDDASGKKMDVDVGIRQLIRLPRLKLMLQVGGSTIYDWMNPKSARFDPEFPRAIKLSGGSGRGGATAWFLSDINRWLDSRAIAGGRGAIGTLEVQK